MQNYKSTLKRLHQLTEKAHLDFEASERQAQDGNNVHATRLEKKAFHKLAIVRATADLMFIEARIDDLRKSKK